MAEGAQIVWAEPTVTSEIFGCLGAAASLFLRHEYSSGNRFLSLHELWMAPAPLSMPARLSKHSLAHQQISAWQKAR
jgi:hypothetical protein